VCVGGAGVVTVELTVLRLLLGPVCVYLVMLFFLWRSNCTWYGDQSSASSIHFSLITICFSSNLLARLNILYVNTKRDILSTRYTAARYNGVERAAMLRIIRDEITNQTYPPTSSFLLPPFRDLHQHPPGKHFAVRKRSVESLWQSLNPERIRVLIRYTPAQPILTNLLHRSRE